MIKTAFQTSCISAFFILTIGCSSSNEVTDSWSGINDLIIEDPDSGRSLGDSFKLNSNLVLPKVDSDTSYTIESHCHVPVTDLENSEAEKEDKIFKKTIEYSSTDNPNLKPLPLINHLNDMVFIYPELFKTCDFIFKAKNAVGSTDSSKIMGAEFEYDKSDHEIGINTSRVDLDALQSTLLFESYSQLGAEYVGELEIEEALEPQADDNGFVNANDLEEVEPPKPLLKNAKVMCYTNEIKTTDLMINDDEKTFSLGQPVDRFHSATENIPAENCVFKALDRNNKIITSQTFDIIHNLKTYDSNVDIKFDFTDSLPNNTQKSYANTDFAKIEKPLMILFFENTSDEERLFKFDTATSRQTDHSYVIMERQEIGRRLLTGQNFMSEISYEMVLENLTSILGWQGEHLDINTGLITLPPRSQTTVTLYFETEKSFFGELGVLVSPKATNAIFNFSGISRNEFKETPIRKGNLKDFFFPNHKVSNVVSYQGENHRALLSESLFNIVFRNEENTQRNITFSDMVELPQGRSPDAFSPEVGTQH